MTRLFIENKELDLTADLSQQITYAIDDIRNIDSKATTFSRTIILPGTANNNNLFGQIFEFNHANFVDDAAANVEYNFNAAKSAQCLLTQDNVQIVKGTLRLLEIVVDGKRTEYEISIFGELGGFITKLGNLRLQDLDFSAYNHNLTVTNIVNSWDNMADGSGYVYPLIDYGSDAQGTQYSTNKKDWRIGTFRPALFVAEYVDKIISNSGYTYEIIWDSAAEETRWNTLIIPYNRKILTRVQTNALELNALSAQQLLPAFTTLLFDFTGYVITLGLFTTSDDQTYTFTNANSIVGAINCTVKLDNYDGTTDIKFRLQKNGTTIREISVNADGSYDLSVGSTQFNNTDTIRLQVASTILNASAYVAAYLQIESSTAVPTPINDGGQVYPNETIPQNILQKDFIISLIKLFNFYVYEDRTKNKHLIFKSYIHFYTGHVIDWSNKLDRSKPMKLKPMSELNSRYYQFKYKSDSDYWNELYSKRYNEGYADRIYDSVFEFSSETKTIEIIFASTPLIGYNGEAKRYSTIIKKNNSIDESTDSVIRILQCAKITGVTSWQLQRTDGTSYASYTKYGFAGHVNHPTKPSNDLNFGAPKEIFFTFNDGNLSVNQFNVYYSTYMAEISDKDSRLLTCSIKLNSIDIYNLDFSKFYFIDGGLYRLMKIIDYNPTTQDVVTVEFLRVIQINYNYEPVQVPPEDV